MNNDDIMQEFVDTNRYVGKVRDWRDVPETDVSEDEPVEWQRESDAPDDTIIRARVLIPDDNGVWVIGDPPVLPGGGVKIGESIREGAVREVLEETGIQVELDQHLCKTSQGKFIVHYFVGKRIGGKPTDLDHDGHTPVNPRIVPLSELSTEQDKVAVAAYLKR